MKNHASCRWWSRIKRGQTKPQPKHKSKEQKKYHCSVSSKIQHCQSFNSHTFRKTFPIICQPPSSIHVIVFHQRISPRKRHFTLTKLFFFPSYYQISRSYTSTSGKQYFSGMLHLLPSKATLNHRFVHTQMSINTQKQKKQNKMEAYI